MAAINIQPQVLDLSFYAGDGFEFTLTFVDGDGNPIDVTGEMEAQVRLDRIAEDTPITELIIDLADADQGKAVLSLAGVQTQQLIAHGKAGKFIGVWDLQWTAPGSQPRTICQGKMECTADVTR